LRVGLGREATLRTLGLWLFAPTTYAERPELVETLLLNALSNPYSQSLTGFLRQGEAIASHDARERLKAIRCPTLVSVAEDDILVPARSREIAARIPGAELRVVSGAGHGYFLEQPDAFNTLSLDSIERLTSR
jgi:pimeloyl-ACP methyl ester carboxylesterase